MAEAKPHCGTSHSPGRSMPGGFFLRPQGNRFLLFQPKSFIGMKHAGFFKVFMLRFSHHCGPSAGAKRFLHREHGKNTIGTPLFQSLARLVTPFFGVCFPEHFHSEIALESASCRNCQSCAKNRSRASGVRIFPPQRAKQPYSKELT